MALFSANDYIAENRPNLYITVVLIETHGY